MLPASFAACVPLFHHDGTSGLGPSVRRVVGAVTRPGHHLALGLDSRISLSLGPSGVTSALNRRRPAVAAIVPRFQPIVTRDQMVLMPIPAEFPAKRS